MLEKSVVRHSAGVFSGINEGKQMTLKATNGESGKQPTFCYIYCLLRILPPSYVAPQLPEPYNYYPCKIEVFIYLIEC